ncbi:hypothetical protein [Mucilaginibacter defluvii]|uniref:Lipocalin-like domain-containing protein n=1 Tax=Mucilaginibacter defluvii TaxID=1196019 RepID=A0ABP9G469_9SPHI
MTKFYAPLLILCSILFFSCKKDNERNIDNTISIVGKWKLVKDSYSLYNGDKLEYSDDSIDELDPEYLYLYADGTGKSANTTDTWGKFNYTFTNNQINYSNYVAYNDGNPLPEIEPFSLSVTSLTATKLVIHEEGTEVHDNVTYRFVINSEFTREK